MTVLSKLPKAMRYIFTALCGLSLVAAAAILAVMVFMPQIETQLARHTDKDNSISVNSINIQTAPGLLVLHSQDIGKDITITGIKGSMNWQAKDGKDFLRFVQRSILPVGLIYALGAAFLCELFRRMFAQVERGNCFTEKTIRLVQIVGGVLILFTLAEGAINSWISCSLVSYLQSHVPAGSGSTVSVSGATFSFSGVSLLPGLLVLALSEVFRQGLALKRENDLTI